MSIQLKTARTVAWAFRFKQLQLSHKAFAFVKTPTVLSRPYFGFDLFLDISRSDTHRLLYLEGERFVLEQGLLRALTKEGDTVIDVGANIGYYMLMFARFVGPRGKIICFEPEPDNHSELVRNMESNDLHNVKVEGSAVGDKNGSACLSRGLNGMVCGNSEEGIQVDLVTLDSETYEKVDLVKIDVEGFEGQVLSGATRLISEFRPALFVEVHPTLLVRPYTTAEILNFVREYYQKVRCYDSQLGSVLNKLASRYRRNARVREITDEKEILARREVFWMVGTEARA